MNIYQRIKALTLVTTLLFWLHHWMGVSVPEGGLTPVWVAVGIVFMLVKTAPLWPFVLLIKDNDVKIVQYLSFSMVFYALLAFWNLLGTQLWLGAAQLIVTCITLYIIVGFGRGTKKAFKAQKAAQEAQEAAAKSDS